jgi:hypothetical protein
MKFFREERGMLFVVSAPSGGGKTTLCKEVVRRLPGFEHGISYTTRKQRPAEVNGKDYHFVTEEQFMQMVENDEFVEYAFVHGNYYGTSLNDIAKTLASGAQRESPEKTKEPRRQPVSGRTEGPKSSTETDAERAWRSRELPREGAGSGSQVERVTRRRSATRRRWLARVAAAHRPTALGRG